VSIDDVTENLLDRWQGRESSAEEPLKRLEGGEPPDAVAAALDLSALDVISALALAGLGPEGDIGPALVQQAPPRPSLEAAAGEDALAKLLPGSSRTSRLALAAGLLQILDFWDASHTAAQEADDLGERHFSAYWHGIAHRREPDAGNASYWFRRVGQHAIYPELARHAVEIEPALSGSWDPYRFIEYSERAARRPGSDTERRALAIQNAEWELLFEHSMRTAAPRQS
jgi:hypothetical protein